MRSGIGTRKKLTRRGQPVFRKRRKTQAAHPFRRTASGFEDLLPQERSEDFFFSQFADPSDAAEFLEHGGEDRDALHGNPRAGVGVSAVFHIVLLLFLLFEPSLNDALGISVEPSEAVDVDKSESLVLFVEEPAPEPPLAMVPLVPVVPDAQPTPQPPPRAADNSLLIPKAMLAPETRPDIMNDLPFSTGNTDEFYTKEEVKDPGTEGDTGEEKEPEPVEVAESGEDEIDALGEGSAEDNGREEADRGAEPEALGDFLFGTPDLDELAREEARRQRERRPPQPSVMQPERGEGGENGRFTDIRRFLAGAQFHNPEGGLVINSNNTMYYNDRGADFVPWIRRMLTEVGRTWRAGMPWAANIYHGHVAVRFMVARDGTVIGYETILPSGVAGFDNIAVGAIRAADLLPLPSDYPDETFEIVLVFWYNERPYDIFG